MEDETIKTRMRGIKKLTRKWNMMRGMKSSEHEHSKSWCLLFPWTFWITVTGSWPDLKGKQLVVFHLHRTYPAEVNSCQYFLFLVRSAFDTCKVSSSVFGFLVSKAYSDLWPLLWTLPMAFMVPGNYSFDDVTPSTFLMFCRFHSMWKAEYLAALVLTKGKLFHLVKDFRCIRLISIFVFTCYKSKISVVFCGYTRKN